MGMDVYGRNPFPLKGKESQGIAAEEAFIKLQNKIGPTDEDGYRMGEWWKQFDTLPQEAKDAYYEMERVVNSYNPGKYFRANIWSWRPIHMLCETVIEHKNLPFDTEGWGENSGFGLEDQEDCDALAKEIDLFLDQLETVMLVHPDKNSDDLRLYINMMVLRKDFSSPFGICYSDGKFVAAKDWTEETAKKYESYLRDRPISHNLEPTEFKVNGKTVHSSYSVAYDHIKEFSMFLKHCGGFEIH